ncbi:GAF domain-containing protein [Agrococcus sp. UYP10]|uniref:GAF and ANTAR domain-containing protein n=1 Tax=Agrococcus sp. UYP10 TaxID=1756355 RepID=UPI003390E9FB
MDGMLTAERLGEALATLAETLTSEYDVLQMLGTVVSECVELVDAGAGGLLLKDAHGRPELVASSEEGVNFVQVMQLNAGDGPCVEAARTGTTVSVADVEQVGGSWAEFRETALGYGYRAVHAVPLRARDEVIGSMGLYRTAPGELSRADAAAARALANLASIGILQERAIRESGLLAEQLQHALDSRVCIEQAKGVIAASADVDMDRAFRMLRDHARKHNLKLLTVAQGVVDRSLEIGPARDRKPAP